MDSSFKTNTKNRAIVLTPAGVGAIAVVRLLGPRTADFLAAHFSRKTEVGRCVHGVLFDGDRQIDDPVVVLLADARGADLNLHGGQWVIRSALDLAARFGFEIVESGGLVVPEDALDAEGVIEREVLAHLPLARTELGVGALLNQARAWHELHRALECMDAEAQRQLIERILEDRSLWFLLHPPCVAIVGAPNVGKSTLANQLFAQERSITADMPGTTRDWVGEFANIDSLAVMLLDTPGIHQTADAIERAAINQSGKEIAIADLVVLVLDLSRPLEPDQSPLLAAHSRALIVLNKTDRPPAWGSPMPDAIQIVATTGGGINALRKRICSHFGCEDFDARLPRWWTQRHRAELERMLRDPGQTPHPHIGG